MNTSCKFQGMGNMVVTINLTTTELSQMLLKDESFRGIVDGLMVTIAVSSWVLS